MLKIPYIDSSSGRIATNIAKELYAARICIYSFCRAMVSLDLIDGLQAGQIGALTAYKLSQGHNRNIKVAEEDGKEYIFIGER